MEKICYRRILKLVLERKIEKNPMFSLRSFARLIKMSPSNLSSVLSSKSGLSPERAREICLILKFSQEKTKHFCLLVESEYSRDKTIRAQAKKVIETMNLLNISF